MLNNIDASPLPNSVLTQIVEQTLWPRTLFYVSQHTKARALTHTHINIHMRMHNPTIPRWADVCFVFERLGENLLSMIKRYNYEGVPTLIVWEVMDSFYASQKLACTNNTRIYSQTLNYSFWQYSLSSTAQILSLCSFACVDPAQPMLSLSDNAAVNTGTRLHASGR